MDFKKNKKMILFACATGIICIILLIISSSVKNKRTASKGQPETQQEVNTLKSAWEEYDKAQNPISREIVNKEINPFAKEEPTEPEKDINSLSIYPSPSYVSDKEDTVIYKKGIYKRVGFVKEKPAEKDTIFVDGKAYIRVKN